MSCLWQLVLIEKLWLLSVWRVNSEKCLLPVVMLERQLYPLYFVAVVIYGRLHILLPVVMLEYMFLPVELYDNVYSMLLHGASMIGSEFETDSIIYLAYACWTVVCVLHVMYII